MVLESFRSRNLLSPARLFASPSQGVTIAATCCRGRPPSSQCFGSPAWVCSSSVTGKDRHQKMVCSMSRQESVPGTLDFNSAPKMLRDARRKTKLSMRRGLQRIGGSSVGNMLPGSFVCQHSTQTQKRQQRCFFFPS